MVHDPVVLAFDVGGTSVKAAALDSGLTTLAESRLPSRRGPAILDVVVAAAEELMGALGPDHRSRVAAAGLAMPGLIDRDRGRCIKSVNLAVTDLDVAGPISARLGVPVRVDHDVAAAGEAVRRTATDADDPFVVVIGTGIAAVAFVRGQAVRGVSGQAGELGHVIVRPGGPPCGCGARGCLEAIAGAGAIVRAYEQRTATSIAGAHVVVERRLTDPVAAEIWDDAVSALADALIDVCALLAPGAVLLAGGLAEAGDALTEPLVALMKERSCIATVPPVRLAGLGSRAGLTGAAHLALDLAHERESA
jgi:glucokinase